MSSAGARSGWEDPEEDAAALGVPRRADDGSGVRHLVEGAATLCVLEAG